MGWTYSFLEITETWWADEFDTKFRPDTIKGKPQFPSPAHNNTGLWYVYPWGNDSGCSRRNITAVTYLCLKFLLSLITKSILNSSVSFLTFLPTILGVFWSWVYITDNYRILHNVKTDLRQWNSLCNMISNQWKPVDHDVKSLGRYALKNLQKKNVFLLVIWMQENFLVFRV